LLSVTHLLDVFGVAGLGVIIFAETGLLVGVFLPGDSLLFTAGLLASQHKLNLAAVLVAATLCAIAGDQVGYLIGRRAGPRLFARPDARVFKRAHLERAERFFDRNGSKTIVLARFVPVVRTFAPSLAGAAGMSYRRFVGYNIAGGAVWASGVPIAGYTLGKTVPSIDRYLLPIIAFIVILSLVPVGLETLRHRRATASV
jgi:membrane-associated protein